MSAAFGMPKTAAGAAQREIIALANGGQAVIVAHRRRGRRAGDDDAEERDQRQRQLADQAARAELTGYAGNVRESATVRIPEEILNPPLF